MPENEYRSIFLSEAKEHLTEIFTKLSEIDKTGKADNDTLYDLFRRFHTLKGMSNTMGLVELGRIAHLLEEMLEYIRKNPDMMISLREFINKGVNSISNEIDNYEAGLPFSSENVILELNYILNEIKLKIQIQDNKFEAKGEEKPDLSGLYETLFEVDKKSRTPSVRAFMLYKELSNKFEIRYFDPPINLLRQGISPEILKIYTSNKLDEDVINVILQRVGEIKFIGSNQYKDTTDVEKKTQIVKYIRVPFERLEDLTTSLDELLLMWNKYRYSLKEEEHSPYITRLEYGFKKVINYAERMRTVPVTNIIPKLNAVVNTTAKALNKSARLVIQNEQIEIDKSIIDRLEEPLLHIIKNGISHGIEPLKRRAELGKQETGTITITFEEEEEYICIRVQDDGRGMDREHILKVAREKGFIKGEGTDMSDEEVFELVFIPGFSTQSKADMTSGRGFGMDIVRNVVWQMGGDVIISSQKDVGTEILLRIPYQFASKKVVIGELQGFRYAFPVAGVRYILRSKDLRYSDDGRYILKQDKKIFLLNYQYKRPNLFIVCKDGDEDIAIGIDDVIFVGETRLYKVPYTLKSSKFIDSMVIVKGICPVPVLSLKYIKDERYL